MTQSPLTLHATAALVIHWGYPVYSGRARKFVDHLDLSAARDLITDCESECPWYGEVILNRKAAIRQIASKRIVDTQGPVLYLNRSENKESSCSNQTNSQASLLPSGTIRY